MDYPKVSVVLGSFNRLDFLKLTLQSIRHELKDFAHEIIVVDGGSTDGALEWLVEQKDVITIVQHNRGEWDGKAIKRRSWGYFMNLGFKCAQGKYICMLSDDCLVVPGAIVNGYNLFESELAKRRKVGAMAFYFRDWSIQNNFHVGCTLGNKMYVNHGMYLNEALKEVGYIDENTCFFYNGDGDVCLEMWQRGYEVIDSPDSFIEHYPHANFNVRKTNYIRYKTDVKNYLKKWENIYFFPKQNNIGRIIEKKFIDDFNTGELFKSMHDEIVQSKPELLKPKPWYVRGSKKCKIYFKAAVNKVFSSFN